MAQAASHLPSSIPSSVLAKLQGLRMKITAWLLIDGLSRVALCLVVLIAVDFAIDWLFSLDVAQRVVMLVICGGILAYVIYARVLAPLLTSVSDEALCLAIERHYGKELNDSLISAVQFAKLGDQANSGVSPQLVRASIEQGTRAADRVPFGSVVDSQWMFANLCIAVICAGLLGVWGYAITAFGDEQYADTNYQLAEIWFDRDILLDDRPWPQNTYLVVEGASGSEITLPTGESWMMTVTVKEESKEQPDELVVDFIMASGARHTEVMEAIFPEGDSESAGDSASGDKPTPIRFEIYRTDEMEPYKFQARVPGWRGARTRWYEVNLIDPPEVEMLTLSTTSPKYAVEHIELEPVAEKSPAGEDKVHFWEGPIEELLVGQGDRVTQGQPLLKLAVTDEGVQTIASPLSGVVKEVYVVKGDEAAIGDRLLTLTSVVHELPPGTGPHHVMKGADFHLAGSANKPLSRAQLVWGDEGGASAKREMKVDGEKFELTVPFQADDDKSKLASGGYMVELWDQEDVLIPGATSAGPIKSKRPARFTLRVTDDRAPEVIAKLEDISTMVLPGATIPFDCFIKDEFAITDVKLRYQWRHEGDAQELKEGELTIEPAQARLGERTMRFTDNFELKPLQIPPGSALSFYIAAKDNNDINGPSEGKSTVFLLRVVTQAELNDDWLRRQIEQRQDFERLLKMEKDLQLEAEVLQAGSREKESLTPQQRQALLQLQKNQKVVGANIGNISKRLESIAQEMENNGLNESEAPLLKKLKEQVIEPMRELAQEDIPRIGDQLDNTRVNANKPDDRKEALENTIAGQQEAIDKMEKILDAFERTEGYQEAVNLLYEIEKTQKLVREQTEKRKDELENEFFDKDKTP